MITIHTQQIILVKITSQILLDMKCIRYNVYNYYKNKMSSLELKVVCGSVQLHLEFSAENAKSFVHDTPIKIKPIIGEAFHTKDTRI